MDPDALQAEVDEWVRDGIITEEQAEAILARYDDGDDAGRSRTVLALSVVGSALVLVGVTLFLATNWDDLPMAGQIAVLLAGPGLAYAAGATAYRRSVPRAGLALTLLGAALAGPSLFLLADLAAVTIDSVWILFAWTAIALPTGHAIGSRVGTGFGLLVLAAVVLDLASPSDPPVPAALLGVALFCVAVARTARVRWTYRVVGAAFVLTGTIALTRLDGRFEWFELEASATLAALALGAIAGVVIAWWRAERAEAAWATAATVAVAVGTVAAVLAPEPIPNAAALAVVHLTALAAVAATGYYGYRTSSRAFVDVAAVGALVQTLSFVAATVVDALSGSIALVVAGTILIVAGVALERGRRSVLATFGR
ncbi:DUF2157 domain-containing protein [Natronomonas salsuginis]|uniref:DUF2157 domain-containing protein n=1 Tax=Natronomonas salsuginis TaxID=2217661 RepID=A0A4U5J957_9EURY|nr:DUF2157 domain-containing protein [Natronomonas salsuginis]TKR25264.1 DUF2157 domain-containing protein [Natronomonas salsuginis]